MQFAENERADALITRFRVVRVHAVYRGGEL